MAEDVYEQMLNDAGIPTTEEAIEAKWRELNDTNNVGISNDSNWSPFWRLITAIVTTPVLWIINLLKDHVLPNAFLKHAKDAYLDMLAWAVDLERKKATKTQGNILFSRADSSTEVPIPADYFIATQPINGTVYRVCVKEETIIPAGTASMNIPVEAEFAGENHNLGTGYFSVLPEPLSGVDSVTNETNWITTPGANEESNDALRLRCKNQFSAVGQYHHDAAYRADIALFASIQTNYIQFEHGAPRGPGSANAYIMIDSGIPSQSFIDNINAYIINEGHHGHGDDMLCFPMPALSKDLSVTVYLKDSVSTTRTAEILNEVENRIQYVFRGNQDFPDEHIRTMPFSRYSFSKFAEELHNAIADIESLAFSLNDIVSTMELPVLNSLTITSETV